MTPAKRTRRARGKAARRPRTARACPGGPASWSWTAPPCGDPQAFCVKLTDMSVKVSARDGVLRSRAGRQALTAAGADRPLGNCARTSPTPPWAWTFRTCFSATCCKTPWARTRPPARPSSSWTWPRTARTPRPWPAAWTAWPASP
jgi:hypothetical protein